MQKIHKTIEKVTFTDPTQGFNFAEWQQRTKTPLVHNVNTKWFARISLLLLTCLNMLTLTVSAQVTKRKPSPRSSYLYQVTDRDKETGDKRIGFIDKTGKLVIGFDRLPKTTIAVGEFHEGRAVIYLKKEKGDESAGNMNYTVGYIDQTGGIIIAPRFDLARGFSEGLAYVEAETEGLRGFIDRNGKAVIKLDGLLAKDFHEGLAAVGTGKFEGKWGYIDRSGKLVVKLEYSFADDFSEGLAGVEIDRKYGFINKGGEVAIPARFGLRKGFPHPIVTVSSGRFSEGLACVRVDDLYGFIDKRGHFVVSPRFMRAQEFSEGLAWVVTTEWKVGWIDKSGESVVTGVKGESFSYKKGQQVFVDASESEDWRYSEGLRPFIVYSHGRNLRGYMDRKGKEVIELKDNEFGLSFVGGVAKVSLPSVGM